jgi:predicted transcriptional regulator of viral defense system
LQAVYKDQIVIETIKHTSDYLRVLRSNGRYAFTMDDLINNVPKPVKNLRKDLDRLREKGEIVNIRREFYTILPDEYRKMGALPVEFYISDLMKHLNKQYYVGLFSAAMYLGAAHQQPQEFFVISESPKPRMVQSSNLRINFNAKSKFPVNGIEDRKTETGYFRISGPELTFLDLIYFEQSMGGFNRISTILQELSEGIRLNQMKEVLLNDFPVSVLQRAGYIAENVLFNHKLSLVFENKLAKIKYQPVLLKSSGKKEGPMDSKWKVRVNLQIESDI